MSTSETPKLDPRQVTRLWDDNLKRSRVEDVRKLYAQYEIEIILIICLSFLSNL